MVGALLCWLGFHDYVEGRVVLETKHAKVIGHWCSRCRAIPPEQRGIP